MEKYDTLAVVGEGSYGVVMRCRHRDTGTLVAIKKFLETEEDATVRKMALREIRMLKKLRHENLVNMIEVFRRKRRFYLVFEYLEHTVLDELESRGGGGLGEDVSRRYIYQVIRAVDFCHMNNVIHRDVKPENVLVSRLGVIKLCDFGFARPLAQPAETYTDYVATRWYRAPELLVGDTRYGGPVDIWAIGCLFAEMMTGDPLFPGDSDVDQLFQIIKSMGRLSTRHQHFISRNPMFKGFKKSQLMEDGVPLFQIFPSWQRPALDLLGACLRLDPIQRPKAKELLKHDFFMHDRFVENFLPDLRQKIYSEFQNNPLLKKYQSAVLISSRREEEEEEASEAEKEKPSDQPVQHKWKINLLGFDGRKKVGHSDSTTEEGKTLKASILQGLYNRHPQKSDGKSNKNKQDVNEKGDQISMKFNQNIQNLLQRNNNSSNSNISSLKDTTSNQLAKQCISNMLIDTRFPPSRQASATNQEQKSQDSELKSPSPVPFQSLQHDFMTISTVLQPAITNISFGNNCLQKNKSPHTLSNNKNNLKVQNLFTNSPVPLNCPPKTQFIKRFDRGLAMEPNPMEKNQNTWVGNTKMNLKKDKEMTSWKNNKQVDDFTLPNLPGAYGSPMKTSKKKLQPLQIPQAHVTGGENCLALLNRSHPTVPEQLAPPTPNIGPISK